MHWKLRMKWRAQNYSIRSRSVCQNQFILNCIFRTVKLYFVSYFNWSQWNSNSSWLSNSVKAKRSVLVCNWKEKKICTSSFQFPHVISRFDRPKFDICNFIIIINMKIEFSIMILFWRSLKRSEGEAIFGLVRVCCVQWLRMAIFSVVCNNWKPFSLLCVSDLYWL